MVRVRLEPMDSKMYLGRAQRRYQEGHGHPFLSLVPFTNPTPASRRQGGDLLAMEQKEPLQGST